MDEEGRRRQQAPGQAAKRRSSTDLGGYDKFKADFIAAGTTQFGSGWAWVSVKDGKLADLQDPERRKPARSRRDPDPRRRCVGALLLHRLPQRRPKYLEAFVDSLINWDYVAKLYSEAK